MTQVLITGAAGSIGQALRQAFSGRYTLLRLADIAAQGAAAPGEELVQADIRDLAAMEQAMQGIDCVVHLAGIPQEGPWDDVEALNINGCYNVFEAARRQGVKRVVFASSNHAVGFHRRERILGDTVQPRPDTLYGVSKVFGEALGRMYADKFGLSVACLRIGTFRRPDRPVEPRHLLTWISHRDMAQLVGCCIDHPDYHFLVAYGVSNNTRSRWSNESVSFLGYKPQDDSEVYASEILAKGPSEDAVSAQFHGGPFCAEGFAGNTDRVK
ncbi:NAD(P)-dependent oxidoreductase [Alcaligenaceae bacterium]|nr:NAD(P)-dependent oxidoreductase [Alcaligenaceae bacterium]